MASSRTAALAHSAKPNRDDPMSVASVARAHLGAIINYRAPGLPLKSAIPRVAAILKINARRVRALWSLEARRIEHDEMSALERELAAISERALTTEIHKHANQLEGYAARLAMADPELYGTEVARLRNLARRARSVLDEVGAA